MQPMYTPVGDMRQQIDLVDPLAPGRNDDGSSPGPTVVLSGVWANLKALSGTELYKAQLISQQVTHMCKIRYQPGLAERMLVMFEGRQFQITVIEDPDERHFELHLLCTERSQNA